MVLQTRGNSLNVLIVLAVTTQEAVKMHEIQLKHDKSTHATTPHSPFNGRGSPEGREGMGSRA